MLSNNHNKLEEINSIKKTLIQNDNALDYIYCKMSEISDILGYNPDDIQAKEDLTTVKYIDFSLSYLDKCYRKRLKELGVKNFKVEEKVG